MRLSTLPVRTRLVAGFVGSMLIVLVAAGAFVYWRVQVDLDRRLNQDLRSQTTDLRRAAVRLDPQGALTSLGDAGREAQLLRADGRVLASGPGAADGPLLSPAQAQQASRHQLNAARGYLFSKTGDHLRILAVPVRGRRSAAVAVTAVVLSQRDEALRELLAQLTIANLLALALASGVGYRLARRALDPVERYRARAEQIAEGATGVRLNVPPGPVDEISRLGATLNAMLEAQERAAQRQRQFIDDASHELRTPLSTLSAEIDLALRKPRTAEAYEQTLRRLAADTTQLVDLAETLLTLGELGSTAPDAEDIAARELLTGAARRARGQLAAHSARDVRVDSAEDLRIHADPRLLERALGNLVDNAVRYGEGTITVAADRRPRPTTAAVILSVHDEGPGMPPDFLPHAAERFRQDEVSRTGPGAGLGLSIVEAIATAHHGQLRICSAGLHHHQPAHGPELASVPCRHPEAGTTVSVLLPEVAGSDAAEALHRLAIVHP